MTLATEGAEHGLQQQIMAAYAQAMSRREAGERGEREEGAVGICAGLAEVLSAQRLRSG